MTKTVFVLGAGASAEYGMPTGRQLKDTLCKGDHENKLRPGRHGNKALSDETCRIIDNSDAIVRERLRVFPCESIDEFLAQARDSNDVDSIIRQIARVLADHQRSLTVETLRAGLYRALFRACYPKLPARDPVPRPGIAIVTFNYDPTLEKAFRTIGEDAYRDQFHREQSMPQVLHVHGRLPWFDLPPNSAEIFTAAEGIRPISRTSADAPEALEEARRLTKDAERVIFLGFGYIKENMDLLGIAEHEEAWASGQTRRVVRGTAFGVPSKGRAWIEQVLRAGASDVDLGGDDVKCEKYLQQLIDERMIF